MTLVTSVHFGQNKLIRRDWIILFKVAFIPEIYRERRINSCFVMYQMLTDHYVEIFLFKMIIFKQKYICHISSHLPKELFQTQLNVFVQSCIYSKAVCSIARILVYLHAKAWITVDKVKTTRFEMIFLKTNDFCHISSLWLKLAFQSLRRWFCSKLHQYAVIQ